MPESDWEPVRIGKSHNGGKGGGKGSGRVGASRLIEKRPTAPNSKQNPESQRLAKIADDDNPRPPSKPKPDDKNQKWLQQMNLSHGQFAKEARVSEKAVQAWASGDKVDSTPLKSIKKAQGVLSSVKKAEQAKPGLGFTKERQKIGGKKK